MTAASFHMQASWYAMSALVLLAIVVKIPRMLCAPYLVLFCASGLWLVESMGVEVKKPVVMGVSWLKIATGK